MEYIVKLLTTFGIIAGAVDLLFLKGKTELCYPGGHAFARSIAWPS